MVPEKKPLTWLITGSSNGFGLALTRYVLTTGDNVIAASRNPAKTPELVKEVEAQANGRWVALDVSWSQDKIKEVIDHAETLFDGGIDVVVNNAAYSLLGAVEDVHEDRAKVQFETNFWGPVHICNAVLPHMRGRGRGTIANISSLLGVTTWPAMGFYSASKFALESISQVLASEVLQFGIRVLIVEPGAFRTNFLSEGSMQSTGPSAPYQSPHPVGESLRHEQENGGRQPGDPEKAARAIYGAVAGKDERLGKVLRLPLGSDCWNNGVAHLDSVRSDFEVCKDVALSMQIEE
ncbi:hypothetical protein DL764_003938 [Monosporascus ibericus]|uniref:Uncharacterized protein n=1 Tax=Monosporascus ibericus TaxID=155417 RepID=A0A4Q4TEM1_9PEZI|nr:hypothetical protein DL764_003938 [Monosporascus ibericus]